MNASADPASPQSEAAATASVFDEAAFKRDVEEYKELGNEYRYRDQLMVQEFSLSMVAVGVLLGVIFRKDSNLSALTTAAIQVFGALFVWLLSLHLRNINQDRRAALARREILRKALNFAKGHGNVAGTSRRSAPREMVRFAFVVAVVWGVWTVYVVIRLLVA